MAAPEVRYCTTEDGVRIAYTITGHGPPVLVCANLFESFSVEHLVKSVQKFYGALNHGRTMIRYDPRNIGLSQRGVQNVSPEDLVLDIEAVVASVGKTPTSIVAPGASAIRAILFTHGQPDLVDHLVLVNAWARTLDVQGEEALKAVAELARTNWSAAARAFSTRVTSVTREATVEQSYLASADGPEVARAILASIPADVSGLLSSITAPTLIVHSTRHDLVPISIAHKMAASIPNARLVPTTWSNLESPEEDTFPPVDAFLPKSASVVARMLDSALRIVLFTDLVGHTEMMQRLGDDKGRNVLREHERITRETLAGHDGAEIKTMGDGFMASFTSVTKAVDCAIALQRAFSAHTASMPEPLHVRVGLNAGEPIEEDGDLFGSTVILASRVAAQAGAGEILIPEPVRHLLSGKSYVYSDRGDVALKGFEDAVRLYEVRWQE